MPYWYLAPLSLLAAGALLYLCRGALTRSQAEMPLGSALLASLLVTLASFVALTGSALALFTQSVPANHVRINVDGNGRQVVYPVLQEGTHLRFEVYNRVTLLCTDKMQLRPYRWEGDDLVTMDVQVDLVYDGHLLALLVQESGIDFRRYNDLKTELKVVLRDEVEKFLKKRSKSELQNEGSMRLALADALEAALAKHGAGSVSVTQFHLDGANGNRLKLEISLNNGNKSRKKGGGK